MKIDWMENDKECLMSGCKDIVELKLAICERDRECKHEGVGQGGKWLSVSSDLMEKIIII